MLTYYPKRFELRLLCNVAYRNTLDRVNLAPQFKDEMRKAPEWGKDLARVRVWSRNLAIRMRSAGGDTW